MGVGPGSWMAAVLLAALLPHGASGYDHVRGPAGEPRDANPVVLTLSANLEPLGPSVVSGFAAPLDDAARTGTYLAQNGAILARGFQTLGATVTARFAAGESRFVTSTLLTGRPATRIAVSHLLDCRRAGTPARLSGYVARAVTGQNILTGARSMRTTARFVFTAPYAGLFSCSLEVVFATEDHTNARPVQVLRGSTITMSQSPLRAHAQTMPHTRVLVHGRANTAVVAGFAPPEGVHRLTVVGDVNLTNCANGYRACPPGRHGVDAVVTTQLIVRQLRAGGGMCRQDATAVRRMTIGALTHHAKGYHALAGVPVVRGCQVTAYLRVQWIQGNTVEIEGGAQTYVVVLAG